MGNDGHIEEVVFEKCPVCKEGIGIFHKKYLEHVYDNDPTKIPPNIRFGLFQQPVMLADPNKTPVLLGATKVKLLQMRTEYCEKCGAAWVASHAVTEAVARVDVQGPQFPPGIPPGRPPLH